MPFSRKRQADNWRGELKVFLLLGFCSFPLGCLQFCPFYHWPHDIFHIPSEVGEAAAAVSTFSVQCHGDSAIHSTHSTHIRLACCW